MPRNPDPGALISTLRFVYTKRPGPLDPADIQRWLQAMREGMQRQFDRDMILGRRETFGGSLTASEIALMHAMFERHRRAHESRVAREAQARANRAALMHALAQAEADLAEQDRRRELRAGGHRVQFSGQTGAYDEMFRSVERSPRRSKGERKRARADRWGSMAY